MKTAFITGASRGIGRAAALAFAEAGYNVAVNCVSNFDMLDSVVQEITAAGGRALAVPCDIADYGAVKNSVERAESVLGGIDVLVNNAGIAYYGLFNEMEPRDYRRLIDVNIEGVLNATSLVLPGMLFRHSGAVINISSIWGNVGASCEAVYSMTKGAVSAFTRALAKETAPNGVRINAIACGVIDTDMNRHLSSDEMKCLLGGIPVGRAGFPEEVAELALFLASDKAAYIAGQVITLDGGMV